MYFQICLFNLKTTMVGQIDPWILVKGAVARGDYFFLNQHNFLITTGMTLCFIYLRTELNYLSNDIILCGFVVVVYKLYRWTSQI